MKGFSFVFWNRRLGDNSRKINLSVVCLGLVWAIGATMAACLILGLWVMFSSSGVFYFSWLLKGVSLLGTFIGGLTAGRRAQNLGWLHGALVGLTYGLVFALLSLSNGLGAFSSLDLAGRLGAYMLLGMAAGVVGINLPGSVSGRRLPRIYRQSY
ncbi:MAG: hypothetical protein XD78_1250 [Desulfotomaculum sp. 46_296]|nr:MAG: hypothetical protein XD78_1250 [Desulfotomaculum sp. 46_296]